MRNSRWDTKARLKNGKPAGFRFEHSDFAVLSLFSSSRAPWGYRNLPTRYLCALTKRPSLGLRLRDLTEQPHDYLCKPPQPKNNFRDLIYAPSKLGIVTLKQHGMAYEGSTEVRAHQMLTDITKA